MLAIVPIKYEIWYDGKHRPYGQYIKISNKEAIIYSYTHDPETGGIILNTTPTGFSKEPRPVYAPELDLLGFDKFWNYDKQSDIPYMWAEANEYIYRGKLVAKLKGGNIFTAPDIIIPNDENGNPIKPEPDENSLKPIDIKAMVNINKEIMQIIEQTTVKKIVNVYNKYKNRLDCFHVAFSGGKDSCVLLDLVKKALPGKEFVVIFGDTGMEFPDTYDLVEKVKQECFNENIPFYTAKSHLKPDESWRMFGPPSRALRWCCSVHKTAPQVLKLREILEKNDFKGLAFVGVRKHESVSRSNYDEECYNEKIKGQYSNNPILEWTSAEIWIYIFTNMLTNNEAYKKGSARVGCLSCPMSSNKAAYVEYKNYTSIASIFIDNIKNSNARKHIDFNEFLVNEGWKARKNGRDLDNNINKWHESSDNDYLYIILENPISDWQEWTKTVDFNQYEISQNNNYLYGKMENAIIKQNPLLGKLFRQVLRKSAYCNNCGVCEANCTSSAIKYINNKIKIDNCIKCLKCHDILSGCLLFHSTRHPQGDKKQMSINTMSNHAPKTEWFVEFFEKKNDFFIENGLGPNQVDFFKTFLSHSGLIIKKKNQITNFAEIIINLGWNTDVAMGLIYINLVSENAQIKWYVNNFDVGLVYSRQLMEDMLKSLDIKQDTIGSIYRAYIRLTETPLGTSLHFGHITDSGDLVRTKCTISDPCVILYGLFKFAEKCGDYKEFTLSTLLNDNIERDGISPTRIFGLDREDMMPILLGLSAKYPDFVNVSFTHDLDKIALSSEKTSQDVLGLFL